MRGVQNTEAGRMKYIQFMSGKLVERVKEDTPGAVSRALTKGDNIGKIVYELNNDVICGGIKEIGRKETPYGWALEITLDCGELEEELYKIGLDFDSFVSIRLMNQLLNHDRSKDITLKAYSIKRDDDPTKFNYYLIAYDGEVKKENKIEQKVSREETPEPTISTIGGKEKKDWFPVADYFYTKLTESDDLPF